MPPRFGHFKPAGVPRRLLKRIELTLDEYEAIRLADYDGLEHLEAAKKMDISRSTFTRLIEKARHKVAEVVIDGREMVIEGGHVDLVNTLLRCVDCGELSPGPLDLEAKKCGDCGSENVEDLAARSLGRGRRERKRPDGSEAI
jgi:predicted DNA-binding protein (UPF0251 family)